MKQNASPDQNTVAHDRVYRGLRTRIMHGEILPGQALTLRGIGTEFGVSMTPARVRSPFDRRRGTIHVEFRSRIYTRANKRTDEELSALRSLIEVELASRALPRAHLALIDRLQRINAMIAAAIDDHDAVAYIRSNLDFHRTLYLRAQAPAMLAMAETVWLQLGPTMRSLYGN